MFQEVLPGLYQESLAPYQGRVITPHPSDTDGINFASERGARYEMLWQYYTNTAFSEIAEWASYLTKNSLYTWTRPLFNPVGRIVDFYAENIYPGALVTSEQQIPGVQNALPLAPSTSKEIRDAIFQLWKWSNWGEMLSLYVTYGALTGSVLVEVVDDPLRGELYFIPYWTGHVSDIALDRRGRVRAYTIQYMYYDRREGKLRKYKKVVDEFGFEVFIDEESLGGKIANPYPFVPAVWVRHQNIGSVFGASVLRTGLPAIDELNSVVSHTADHIHLQVNSPRILWTDGRVRASLSAKDDGSEVSAADFDNRRKLTLLRGAKDGKTETLVGNLDPATIIPLVDRLIGEIERIYPEVNFYEKLRDQNIVTSVGAQTLMGDVQRKIAKPATAYDRGLCDLFAMGMAIGGWRANNGDWALFNNGVLTNSQRKFLPFDYNAFASGELTPELLPRPLVPETENERATVFELKARGLTQVEGLLPKKEQLLFLGYKEDEVDDMIARAKQEADEANQRAIQLAQSTRPQPTSGSNNNQ